MKRERIVITFIVFNLQYYSRTLNWTGCHQHYSYSNKIIAVGILVNGCTHITYKIICAFLYIKIYMCLYDFLLLGIHISHPCHTRLYCPLSEKHFLYLNIFVLNVPIDYMISCYRFWFCNANNRLILQETSFKWEIFW